MEIFAYDFFSGFEAVPFASLMIHAEKSMFHAENVLLGKVLIQFVEIALNMKEVET